MKLNKAKNDLLSIRQRIATHTTSLQTILQVINMYARAPDNMITRDG